MRRGQFAELALFLLSLFGIRDIYPGSGINHYAVPSVPDGEISSVVLSVPKEERKPMCRGIPFYSSHSRGTHYYKKTGRFVVLAGLGRISWLFGREFGLHFCLGRFSYLDAESGNL